jgi:pimeloyl-ACP methyl ester carboxylesterase
MGTVLEEFEDTLARLRRRHRGDLRQEFIALLLLAMEREQLVSIAYRDQLIQRRLAAMSLPCDVREILRHGIAWAWKDEEMHAIYTRGLLLRIGSPGVRTRALIAQIAGSVAGWASSVQQHGRWSHAPVARTLAETIAWAGRIAGKVPRGVQDRLRFLSFRDFCELQVDAERTAALCWQRIAALAQGLPEISPQTQAEFGRMAEDEERHRHVFAIMARALGPGDALDTTETVTSLADKARAISEFFLPRSRRSAALAEHPLGRGGRVWVIRGEAREDKLAVFCGLLDKAGLAECLAERAEACGKTIADLTVVIKSTFMLGCDRRDLSIITDPVLIEELARHLRQQGCGDVAVAEGRNVYDHFLANRSVRDVARYLGMTSPHYRVVDLTEEQVPHVYSRGMAQDSVARTWKEADVRIVFAKMRSHPVDLTHLTLGGIQGVGARLEHFLFAERQAHRDTALLMPLTDFPPHFALIDAYDSAADGLVGIIGCRTPPRPRRFYAGRDWPGMGESVEWKGGASPTHMAERLMRLMTAWGFERADLVGMDMGGQPALVAAALWPERVRRLCIMNSLVLWDEETSWEIRLLRRHGWNRVILRHLPAVVFARAQWTFLPRGVRLPRDLRADFWRCFRRRDVRQYIARMCAAYQGSLRRLPGHFERIRCPTLALWGASDRHFPLAHATRLHAAIPGSRLCIIPGAEHWMPWYLPERVAEAICEFANGDTQQEATPIG